MEESCSCGPELLGKRGVQSEGEERQGAQAPPPSSSYGRNPDFLGYCEETGERVFWEMELLH